MVHVGVDLDKRSSQIAILTEDGDIVQQRLANDGEQLAKFFSQLPPQSAIAIEASGTWWWLVDLLEKLKVLEMPLAYPASAMSFLASAIALSRVAAA
jgi:hypothetical protein